MNVQNIFSGFVLQNISYFIIIHSLKTLKTDKILKVNKKKIENYDF